MASKKNVKGNPEKVPQVVQKVVEQEPEPTTEVTGMAQPGLEPQQQPEYSLNWMVQLTYKDKMGQHIMGSYSNSVMTDTMKLIERACTMAGQQMFQKIVEDPSV